MHGLSIISEQPGSGNLTLAQMSQLRCSSSLWYAVEKVHHTGSFRNWLPKMYVWPIRCGHAHRTPEYTQIFRVGPKQCRVLSTDESLKLPGEISLVKILSKSTEDETFSKIMECQNIELNSTRRESLNTNRESNCVQD